MRGRALISLTFLILLFILTGCNLVSHKGTTPKGAFTFSYTESGGFAGINHVLTFTADDSLLYKDRGYLVERTISPAEKQTILSLIRDKHFFKMSTSYLPPQGVADDIYFTISYDSPTLKKKVKASGACSAISSEECSWPEGLRAIVGMMQQKINQLKDETTYGCVKIHEMYNVTAWPFGKEVMLANSLNKPIEISDSVAKAVRVANESKPRTLFYEGTWIYSMYIENYSQTLYVTGRVHPNFWHISPAIRDISGQGIEINGSDYTWLDSVVTHPHYPWYFMDHNLSDGSHAYELNFLRGSHCQ